MGWGARKRTGATAVGAACFVGVCAAPGCSAVLGVGDWPDLTDGGGEDVAPDRASPRDSATDGGDGGGPTCSLPAGGYNGGLLLASGYQTVLGRGYCNAFSDSTSDAFVASSNLCGCGTSGALAGSTSFGAGIGCSINQGMGVGGTRPGAAPIDPAVLGIGIHYNLGTLPTGPDEVILTVNNGSDQFDCMISTATGTCLWPAFTDNPTGTVHLKTAPTGASNVNVLISAGYRAESWKLCIASLAFVAAGSGGIGDPCFGDEDCISSTCTGTGGAVGWCTKACTPTSDCDGNYPANVNAQNNLNTCASSLCAPVCAQESDCASLGADCIGGVCVVRSPTGGIGDPCFVSGDCEASLVCGAIGFCTTDCVTAADCYGSHANHQNAQGTANMCNPCDGCFPECTQPSDCSVFQGSSCEAVDGGPSICSL